MSDFINFQLGPLAVRVEGDHPIVRWATRVFKPLAHDPPGDASPGLTFRLSTVPLALDAPQEAVGDRLFQVGRDELLFQLRRFDVLVGRDGDALRSQLRQRDLSPLWRRMASDPEETWKMWLSHGASLDMHLLKDFAYTISPMLFMGALLERSAALIHASAFAVDGQAALLPAWGGVGKSTVVSRAVLHGRGRFLADDHAVIDSDGLAHLHPLPMHIYSYHAAQDAVLRERLLATLSPPDRAQWRLAVKLRPKRAVRWVQPWQLFGEDRVCRAAPLAEVIVMFRGRDGAFQWQPLSPAEAARPCAGVIFEEINGLGDRLALASAGWAEPILPSLAEAYTRVTQLYERAFSRARCARVMIPAGASGDDLMRFLAKRSPLIAAAGGNSE